MEKRTKIIMLILISTILIAYTWNYYCGVDEQRGNEITSNENFTNQPSDPNPPSNPNPTSDPDLESEPNKYIQTLQDKIGELSDKISSDETKINIERDVDFNIQNKLKERLDNILTNQIIQDNNYLINKQNEQDTRVGKLQEELATINTLRKDISENIDEIKQISSAHNSEHISVRQLDNGKYLININNKCLTSYGDKDYELNNCRPNSLSQQFKISHIPDATTFRDFTGNSYEADSNNPENPFPFNIVQSELTKQCLKSNDDGVSIEPCDANNKTYWDLSSEDKVCLDD